jgi:hypothetical protein
MHGSNYLFVFSKKKISNTEKKILQNPKNPTHPNSNQKILMGPFRQILKDRLGKCTVQITSSFFLKKNIQYGKKILQNPENPTHPNSNQKILRGPL